MASTVEQCESKSIGPLSSTLEMFDTFKNAQEDDKDSDEESFHLPLLGCDDDLDNGKDLPSGKYTPNDETEDDILNKFETSGTPDLDPKLEEKMLNEDENISKINCDDTKVIDSIMNKNEKVANEDAQSEKGSSDEGLFNDLELVDEIKETSNSGENLEAGKTENKNLVTESEEQNIEQVKNLQTDESKVNDEILTHGNELLEDPKNDTPIADESINITDDKIEINEAEKTKINEDEKKGVNESEKIKINKDENMEINEDDIIEINDEKMEVNDDEKIETNADEKIKSNEVEKIEINEDEKIEINEDEKIEINEVEINEVEKIEINEDEKIEINEDEKIEINEVEKIEINEVEKIEINEVEKIEISEVEKIEVNEVEKIEINEDEKIEVNEVDKIGVNNSDKTEIIEDEKAEINEDKVKEIMEDNSVKIDNGDSYKTENNDPEKIENNDSVQKVNNQSEKIVNVASEKLENNVSEKIENHDSEKIENDNSEKTNDSNELPSNSGNLEEIENDKNTDKIDGNVDKNVEIDNIAQEELLLNKQDEKNEDQSKDNIEDNNENNEEASKESVNVPNEDHMSTKLEEKVVEKTAEATPLDSANKQVFSKLIEEVSKEEEDEIAMEVDEPEYIEISDEHKSEEKLNTGHSNKETDEKDNHTEKTQTESDEKDFECDNLLDISVIRDVDEDNACAIAETTENHSSEKSDIDELEEKQETEADDMELEQEDTQTSTERDEPMEFDDNTNSCDQDNSTTDNLISENTSDGENKENEPVENVPNNRLSVDDITEIESSDSGAAVQNAKSQDESEKPLDSNDSAKPVEDVATIKPEKEVPIKPNEKISEKLKENVVNKRPLSQSELELEGTVTKKIRLDEKTEKTEKSKKVEEKKKTVKNEKVKTLINFEQYMKKRNLGEGKLTRSDLEQFCLQKVCEAVIHKTDVGELHQTIKKQEAVIETLRKDLAQLTKQTRDLDIVNRKLMNELKMQNGNQKPLVPLKITRSVGLQVKLNLGAETVNRRKSYTTNTPRTPNTPTTPNNQQQNRTRVAPPGSNVVRQVAQTTPIASSPRKTPAQAPILTQALQTRPTPTPVAKPSPVNNKRPAQIRPKAAAEPAKPSAPGVIDLTDEDDKSAKNVPTNNITQKNVGNKPITAPVKLLNKNIIVQNKTPNAKPNNASPKTVVKTQGMQTKVGMQARAMANLPQGVRLTTTQMKNGITIPASVVTSNAQGTTQLMYVVQPGSLVNTTAGGGQKAVLLNFQPTNGVLTSTINGSTVSVIPSKTTNSMQLKTMPMTRKHPAALPLPPPAMINNSLKKLLPKPHLSIRKTDTGIILQWRMPYNLDEFEGIASYQLFAYQETNAPPSTDMWRKVGDVKALALPMACTLTQFADKNKYYFAVRSVDVHKRIGAFSDPEEISL